MVNGNKASEELDALIIPGGTLIESNDINIDLNKEISPECSLEGLMLKLNFSYLMRRVNSLEKILMLGKTEGKRRRGRQRMRWLHGVTDSMDVSLSRSEEHTSELQSHIGISYAVFCLKKFF